MLIFCCKFKIFFINSASYRQNSFKFCPFSFFIGEIRGKRRVFGREQQRFRDEERRSACRVTIVGSVFHYSGKHFPLQWKTLATVVKGTCHCSRTTGEAPLCDPNSCVNRFMFVTLWGKSADGRKRQDKSAGQ